MIRNVFFAAALAIAFAVPAQADDVSVGAIKISAPWARATPKGASVGGGYFNVTNTGTTPDRLVGGVSDVAQRFEVHVTSMDNGVAKMREMVKGVEIKPGETVAFKPGGNHAMFVGLNRQLTEGEHFKATLKFEKAGPVDIDFPVQGIGAQNGGASHGMPHGH